MKRYGFFILILATLLVGCNNEKATDEQTPQHKESKLSENIKYGEQIPMQIALSAISFVPKQMQEDKSPFPIKKTTAIINKTNKPSDIIDLRYGGLEHYISLEVENTEELKKNSSMEYEEMILKNGKIAYYSEDEHYQYISWVENNLSYLMTISYKVKPITEEVTLTKDDIVKIVNELE